MPEFLYYNLENWFLCYYYPYMTISCQGLAFLMGVLYKYGVWYQYVWRRLLVLSPASPRTGCGTCGAR